MLGNGTVGTAATPKAEPRDRDNHSLLAGSGFPEP